jgi:hypothetical protein
MKRFYALGFTRVLLPATAKVAFGGGAWPRHLTECDRPPGHMLSRTMQPADDWLA